LNLMDNEMKVYEYLRRISPEWATISDIEQGAQVHPHQQVFQITQRLVKKGKIRGEQERFGRNEWKFTVKMAERAESILIPGPQLSEPVIDQPILAVSTQAEIVLSPAGFERLAEQVMSRHYGVTLRHGSLPGVPKDFDLVSADRCIAGDSKFFTLVGGERNPSAKNSVIAEYVWLLEKTKAEHKFLVFGNQKEVPQRWLAKYGSLVEEVEFFFLTEDGSLEKLN
jgi:hypothetical protein